MYPCGRICYFSRRLKMEIKVNQELLDEINIFIHNKLVKHLNDDGLSFAAMSFILQTLLDKIDEAQEELDKSENL